MAVKYTDPQIQKLREYGDNIDIDVEFDTAESREAVFSKTMSKMMSNADKAIKGMIEAPTRHELADLEARLAKALVDEGFVEVKTPTMMPISALAKMTITEDHPLYKQVFFIDSKRCLRPMLAPNLYVMMKKLREHSDGEVLFFEIGSCFRKESHSSRHLEEFTMLNLVDMGSEGVPTEKLKRYIEIVMSIVGLEYELSHEESDVYKETLDVNVGETEVCSAAVGPHVLDAAHDVHEPWCGAGFGLERLLMLKKANGNAKKSGRSLSYLNGVKMN